jgi:hypothetical protein
MKTYGHLRDEQSANEAKKVTFLTVVLLTEFCVLSGLMQGRREMARNLTFVPL